MAEGIAEPIQKREPEDLRAGRPPRMAERLRSSPVLVKELRGRMRGFRAFGVLTLYLVMLSCLISMVYLFVRSSNTTFGSVDERQILGKAIFGMVIGIELMAVCFIGPGLTAGAISAERERQTFDLLRTTLLPARSVVLGKFLAALLYILLLIFAALPLQSLAFLFGGVAPEEVLVGFLMLVVTAVAFCAVGLFFSSLLSRTLVSTVLTYAFAILWVFGLPFLLLFFSGLFSSVFNNINNVTSPAGQSLLLLTGWLMVSANPLAAAVASEVILLQNQSLFTFSFPLPNGPVVTLLSPWIIYVSGAVLASLLLLWLSVQLVRRVEK